MLTNKNLLYGADQSTERKIVPCGGVLKTDFYIAEVGLDGPPRYRFITEIYWDNIEILKEMFFSKEEQEKLVKGPWGVTDRLFLISNEVWGMVNDRPISDKPTA